jgi:hypothetical protein
MADITLNLLPATIAVAKVHSTLHKTILILSACLRLLAGDEWINVFMELCSYILSKSTYENNGLPYALV